jgi:TatD family hydrolase
VEEENYFFRLSKYQNQLKEKIEKDEYKIIPEARKNETLSFIKQGLEDVSFSRSKDKLKWGISVPGDDSQVIYVWADALTNYISAIGYTEETEQFKKYWPADVHCIGKDILKFHSLFWPAMLLSLGIDLPKTIFVHGFITADGEKMSKSLGNVIDPFELVKKYGTDPVRYYLLREIPSSEDGDFSYDKFEQRYNSDLLKGIGNLVARVRVMVDGVGFENNDLFEKEIKVAKDKYKVALDNFKFNEALKVIWDLIGFCDKYIEETKPWEKKDNSPQALGALLIVLDSIADLLNPFLPETSEKIKKEIARDNKEFDHDFDQVIKRSLSEKVWMINVGSKYETSKKALEIAKQYDNGIFAAVGLHPIHAQDEEFDKEKYKELAKSDKVLAIGEIGLDYFKDYGKFKDKQKQVFLQQLDLAKELDLPIILHCRMAHNNLLEIIKGYQVPGLVHCFSGDWEQAKKYLDLGFYIGINGIIYKRDLKEVIEKTPLEKILIETDCPYLTPPQLENKRNEPINVRYIAKEIAKIKAIDLETVIQTTFRNAADLFNI